MSSRSRIETQPSSTSTRSTASKISVWRRKGGEKGMGWYIEVAKKYTVQISFSGGRKIMNLPTLEKQPTRETSNFDEETTGQAAPENNHNASDDPSISNEPLQHKTSLTPMTMSTTKQLPTAHRPPLCCLVSDLASSLKNGPERCDSDYPALIDIRPAPHEYSFSIHHLNNRDWAEQQIDDTDERGCHTPTAVCTRRSQPSP